MKGIIRILLIGIFIFGSWQLMAADAVVIANSEVAAASLDKATLQKIFLGKVKKWEDGSKVIPVTLKKGDLHNSFLKKFIAKTASQFSSYWKQMIFSGKGTPPKSFETEAELKTFVAANKGAVGYAAAGGDGLKVLTVAE